MISTKNLHSGLRFVFLAILPMLCSVSAGCTVHKGVVDLSPEELVKAHQPPKVDDQGCMPWGNCDDEQGAASPQVDKILEVVLASGEVVRFDESGGKFIPPGTIEGLNYDGVPVAIPIDQVSSVRVVKTISISSCPFVYSYNGEKYVLDAEPLGGSIAQGLEKTDYTRLDHLRPVDGRYRLVFRNEAEETQYVDEVKLLVVDHPKNQRIIPDLLGELYAVETPVAPAAATDEAGQDLMKLVRERDMLTWQTDLASAVSVQGGNLRHQLTFTFSRPRGANTAKLLVNAGTALWGSHMVREMLELRGDKVDAWYEAVHLAGPELFGLLEFNAREELYILKVYVNEGGSWVARGFIPGGGPLVPEDRIIPLDLSGVQGDTVDIRLNPPKGFWSIDYLGMEYGDRARPAGREVAIASAEHRQGDDDTKELLSSPDNRYVVMPELGDWVRMEFDAPGQAAGTERTVFLRTSGYYELHLSKDRPEQTALIQRFAATPGAIIEYSMERHRAWRSQALVEKRPGGSRN